MSFFAHLCYFAKESLGSFSTVAAEALVTICVEDGYNKFTYGTPPPVPANVTPHSIAEPVKVVATVSRETQLPFFKLAFTNDTAVWHSDRRGSVSKEKQFMADFLDLAALRVNQIYSRKIVLIGKLKIAFTLIVYKTTMFWEIVTYFDFGGIFSRARSDGSFLLLIDRCLEKTIWERGQK